MGLCLVVSKYALALGYTGKPIPISQFQQRVKRILRTCSQIRQPNVARGRKRAVVAAHVPLSTSLRRARGRPVSRESISDAASLTGTQSHRIGALHRPPRRQTRQFYLTG